MNKLGVKEIEAILPHRHPFLLVDYIEDYEPGKFAVGYKCVTFREDFFRGHFPQEPVMPGVLMGKVVPGDKLRLETTIIKCKGPVGVGHAVATVDGKVVVDAELTFMIG